jgi:membrane fusion protein, heavy metal efflux system
MAVRPITVVAFVAGAAVALGASTLQRMVGTVAPAAVAQREARPNGSAIKPAVVAMDDERIKLAQIELQPAAAGIVAKRLAVPGTIVPDAARVAHVSVKLSGTVAELRKNIGDDVVKDEIIAVLESRGAAWNRPDRTRVRARRQRLPDRSA